MSRKTTTTKKPAAKKTAKRKWRGPNAMGKSETVPLAIAAREAYDYQASLGLIEDGEKFDDWRRAQVLAQTGRSGLSDCDHVHFQPLLAHFQMLAGKDSEALAALMKSGQVRDNGPADDTHEKRAQLAFTILEYLEDHMHLAKTPWPEFVRHFDAKALAAWEHGQREIQSIKPDYEPQRFPGSNTKLLAKLSLRKEFIEENGGPIEHGYLITIIRNKTRRPDLKLTGDLKVAIADRCTVKQLTEIRDTLVNRINAREGVGSTRARNKKQSDPKTKAAKKAAQETPRW